MKFVLLLVSLNPSLREKCPCSELIWSVFSRIRTEYGNICCKNSDQNNSEYGHFLRSVFYTTGFFVYSLKTLENICFFDVFRGYRNRLVTWNRLMMTQRNCKQQIFTKISDEKKFLFSMCQPFFGVGA